MLLCKLRHVAGWNAQRARAADYYSTELDGIGDLQLPPVAEGELARLAPLRRPHARSSSTRCVLARAWHRDGRHYPEPPHLSPAYAHLGFRKEHSPLRKPWRERDSPSHSSRAFPSRNSPAFAGRSGPSSRMASGPANDAPHRLIVDVAFGDNVHVHSFTNLYGCRIGDNTRIGPFVEIQRGAVVGANCKIQSHSFVCEGVELGDEVFIGHGVMFINDKFPRATNDEGGFRPTPTGRCCERRSSAAPRSARGRPPRWGTDRRTRPGRRRGGRDAGRRGRRDSGRQSARSSLAAPTGGR